MDTEPILLTFEEPWFSNDNSVEGLLRSLDLGESVAVKDLKEACEREGITFKIIVE